MRGRRELCDALLADVERIAAGSISSQKKIKAVCELLAEKVPHYDWVGFYVVDRAKGNELVLGAYVGEPTEHTRIAFGRGICGQAADKKKTVVIDDVRKENNYLACSLKVKSEIVVPILKDGDLVAELDIDSHTAGAFLNEDRRFLERVCARLKDFFN